MRKHKFKNNSGFIALMSAITVSVILLLIVTNLSLTGFYARSDISDFEYKDKSVTLAESCVDNALLRLANNPSYTGLETITIFGSNTCNIESITPSTDPIIVGTKAVFQNATTHLRIKVNKSDLSVVSWEEI